MYGWNSDDKFNFLQRHESTNCHQTCMKNLLGDELKERWLLFHHNRGWTSDHTRAVERCIINNFDITIPFELIGLILDYSQHSPYSYHSYFHNSLFTIDKTLNEISFCHEWISEYKILTTLNNNLIHSPAMSCTSASASPSPSASTSSSTCKNNADNDTNDWLQLCKLYTKETTKLVEKIIDKALHPKERQYWKSHVNYDDTENKDDINITNMDQVSSGINLLINGINTTPMGSLSLEKNNINGINYGYNYNNYGVKSKDKNKIEWWAIDTINKDKYISSLLWPDGIIIYNRNYRNHHYGYGSFSAPKLPILLIGQTFVGKETLIKSGFDILNYEKYRVFDTVCEKRIDIECAFRDSRGKRLISKTGKKPTIIEYNEITTATTITVELDTLDVDMFTGMSLRKEHRICDKIEKHRIFMLCYSIDDYKSFKSIIVLKKYIDQFFNDYCKRLNSKHARLFEREKELHKSKKDEHLFNSHTNKYKNSKNKSSTPNSNSNWNYSSFSYNNPYNLQRNRNGSINGKKKGQGYVDEYWETLKEKQECKRCQELDKEYNQMIWNFNNNYNQISQILYSFVIVATKCDLLKDKKDEYKVNRDLGINLAYQWKCPFFETSGIDIDKAKDGMKTIKKEWKSKNGNRKFNKDEIDFSIIKPKDMFAKTICNHWMMVQTKCKDVPTHRG